MGALNDIPGLSDFRSDGTSDKDADGNIEIPNDGSQQNRDGQDGGNNGGGRRWWLLSKYFVMRGSLFTLESWNDKEVPPNQY